MAADVLAHPPLFTDEELARLRTGFMRDMAAPPEQADLDVVICSWVTTCWNCDVDVRVWMQAMFFEAGIGASCLRADVRRGIPDKGPAHALISRVTTKAGGTYLGFTCPWCHSVQGKHFLRIDLYRRLLNDADSITKLHFVDEEAPLHSPLAAMRPLTGTEFPQTRANAFKTWRKRARSVIAYRRANGRYPTKRENMAGEFLNVARTKARAGTLNSERRAYLDVHLPDWLPVIVTAVDQHAQKVQAVAEHRARTGSWPMQDNGEVERKLATWLQNIRIRHALGKLSIAQKTALDDAPGWDSADVPDAVGNAMRIARGGFDITDPELSKFLKSERKRFGNMTLNNSYRDRMLDRIIPGWERGPDFAKWFEREAEYVVEEMRAGEDYGRDMIHDVDGIPRCGVFFDRLDKSIESGFVSDVEFEQLHAWFPTFEGWLDGLMMVHRERASRAKWLSRA
jgi:hypothetical protein